MSEAVSSFSPRADISAPSRRGPPRRLARMRGLALTVGLAMTPVTLAVGFLADHDPLPAHHVAANGAVAPTPARR